VPSGANRLVPVPAPAFPLDQPMLGHGDLSAASQDLATLSPVTVRPASPAPHRLQQPDPRRIPGPAGPLRQRRAPMPSRRLAAGRKPRL